MRKLLFIISVFAITLVAGCSEKQKTNKPVQKENIEIKTEILDNSNKEDTLAKEIKNRALISAIQDNDLEKVKTSIKEGANVNDDVSYHNEEGSPLYLACGNGNTEIVKLLLDAGADANQEVTLDWGPFTEKKSPLTIASKQGHVDIVKILIKAGADVNMADKNGKTPLMVASEENHAETVKALIDAGAKVNIETEYGSSALRIASEKNHTEIIKILLDAGARKESFCELVKAGELKEVQAFIKAGTDVNASTCVYNPCGDNDADEDSEDYCDLEGTNDPLIRVAAELGYTEIVKELIKAGADVNEKCTTYTTCGDTALTIFSKNGNLDMVQTLLKAGANVNLDKAVYEASKLGHTEIVKELIKAGAAVNYISDDSYNPTPLSIALKNGHKETAALLKKHGAKESLFPAIYKNNLEEVKRIIKEGADIESTNSRFGGTVLMQAIIEGNTEIVKALVDAGANVNRIFNKSFPLYEAVGAGNVDIIKILIDAGADVNEKGAYNEPALFQTLNHHHTTEKVLNIIKILIKAGADVNMNGGHNLNYYTPLAFALSECRASEEIINEFIRAGANVNDDSYGGGHTALILAIHCNYTEVVKALLTAGADVNKARNDGATPLMFATQCGKKDIVALLLEYKADVNKARNDGVTPLMFAAALNYHEITKFLIDKGANLDLKEKNGQTALMYAQENGHTEIVELLKSAGAKG